MKQPTRSPGIPEDATWDGKENIWQLGEYKGQGKKRVPVGRWSYWTEQGHLVCIANYDDQGRQHGLIERFHPDGSLASRAEWENGNRHGHFVFIRGNGDSNESYPGGYATWRFEFDSFCNWEEENLHWYLEDGTECTSDGRPLDTAYDLDEAILSANPKDFLNQAAATINRLLGEKSSELRKDRFELKELWGATNEQIDKFAAYAVNSDDFTKCDSRRLFEGNIWESLIAYKWGNRYEELGAVFMGAVQIGGFGDCDSIYATVIGDENGKRKPGAVYFWSHETYCIDEVLSLDLDSFAYRVAVSSAYSAQRLSPAAAPKAWLKLVDNVYVGWECACGLSCLTEADENCDDTESGDARQSVDSDRFKVELDPRNEIRGAYWRAEWIISLLESDEERKWDYVKKTFRSGWNRPYDDTMFNKMVETGNQAPQLALYLLWRFFFFNQQERLNECLKQYRKHDGRLVRDLVELLEDFEAGRLTSIGQIANLGEVRRLFLELSLCPEQERDRLV